MSRLLFIGFSGLCLSLSVAQTPAPHQKILTPEQQQYQADMARWNQRIKEIHAQGQSALDAELAREKQPLCPDADNTRSQEVCLQSEGDKTQANYQSFAEAIRSTLALSAPTFPGSAPPASGPTGVPLSAAQFVAEFDYNQQEWKKYEADQAQAAFDQYKSGTLAPVFEGQAHLRLTRLHMRELAFIYGWKLSTPE
jgi:hypothetical protein